MGTPNRVQALTVDMIKRDAKNNNMRTKGAENRSLVPFALELAMAMHETQGSAHTQTVMSCVSALMDFYMLLGLAEVEAPSWSGRVS